MAVTTPPTMAFGHPLQVVKIAVKMACGVHGAFGLETQQAGGLRFTLVGCCFNQQKQDERKQSGIWIGCIYRLNTVCIDMAIAIYYCIYMCNYVSYTYIYISICVYKSLVSTWNLY